MPGAAEAAQLSAREASRQVVVRGNKHVLLITSHRPGILSLRPLTFGELVDAAVKHIRRSPGPVLSASLLVLVVASAPAVVLAGLAARGSWYADLGADAVVDQSGSFWLVLLFGVGFASLVLVGGLSYSVGEAILGRRPSLGEIVRAMRPRVLPLLGLAVLITGGLALPLLLLVLLVALAVQANSLLGTAVVVILGGLAVAAWSVFLVTRTCVAGCAVVLERRGVFAALNRSWALTSKAFWRTAIRLIVVALICVVVFWVISLPLLIAWSLVSSVFALSPSMEALSTSLGLAVATLLSASVVAPFAAGAACLHYVDQRMRKEGFDLVLQRAARRAGVNV